jgi:hypothetical protein
MKMIIKLRLTFLTVFSIFTISVLCQEKVYEPVLVTNTDRSPIITMAGTNLTPYQPAGWDDKIVLSTVTGTNVSASIIYNTQTIYLDWAVINNGTSDITGAFTSKLYIDGTLHATYVSPSLNAGYYAYISDAVIAPLEAGSHTFKVVVDSEGNIAESNEGDNEYSRTKTITYTVCTNLTPFQPDGWDDKLVLSTSTGSNISASTIYDNQTIYLDWAELNNGSCSITQAFSTRIYVDDVLKTTYNTPGLTAGYYAYIIDASIGPLSAGSHTFKIVVDANNNVTESDESDNEYTRTKTIQPHPVFDIDVVPVSLTINQSAAGSQSDLTVVSEPSKRNNQVSGNQYHGRGIVVPEYVKEYWITHESPVFKSPQNNPNAIIDWSSQDSPVKTQLCGSCWAFAAIGLIENLGLQTDLSEQVVISCNTAGDDCAGGWPWNALSYIKSLGVPPESCYPSVVGNGNCLNSCSNPPFRERVTSFTPGTGMWGEVGSVENLKAILNNGPAVVTMIVPTDNSFDNYSGGVYNYTGVTIPWKDNAHAVLCVGYDDNQQCFKVKNSWGPSWGEAGYFRIAYNDVTDWVHFGGYAVQASGVYTQPLTTNSFIISSTGSGSLNVSSLTDNKDWLTTTGYPVTPFSIASSASHIVSVAINWSLLGNSTQTGAISIASNDPDEPVVVVQVTAVPSSCATPLAPIVGTITQPTCSVVTGSVVLTGLPSTGIWTLTRSPGGAASSGAGSSTGISGLTTGVYTYSVTNASGCTSSASGNVVINGQPVKPSVTTSTVRSVSSSTAEGGGNVISSGGSSITMRGVCWSTSANPTIANSKTNNGTSTGQFTSLITGLTNGVTYHLRAYATNCVGTEYGSDIQYTHNPTEIDNNYTEDLSVYPNPVTGMLNIEFINTSYNRINILNSQGVIVSNERVGSQKLQIDFTRYKPGLYILEFIKKSGEIVRIKIIRNI